MFNAAQLKTITDKALNDAKFRALAKKDGRAALESAGVKVPAGTAVHVFENTPAALHVVLPAKVDLKGSPVDPQVLKVFEKAWADASFKKQLLSSPAEAIKAATGAQIPKNLKITAHEDGKDSFNFVLPYVAPASGELSDADLEMVAGGKGAQATQVAVACGAIAGNVAMVGAVSSVATGGIGFVAGLAGGAIAGAVSAAKA
jgi:hypothetical protein